MIRDYSRTPRVKHKYATLVTRRSLYSCQSLRCWSLVSPPTRYILSARSHMSGVC